MSDYKQTRDAASNITTRFERVLRNMKDDYEEAITVASLMNYYNLCCIPNKDEGGYELDLDTSILEAIERVLEDYLSEADYNAWMLSVKEKYK